MTSSRMGRRRSSPNIFGIIAANMIPAILIAALAAWLCVMMTQHVVFWLAGVWIPWFVAIFGGVLGPVLAPTWFILWVLHFTAIHFPLFHG